MLHKSIFAGIILLSVFFLISNKTHAETPKGFALIELYTSEGCSSCPPADQSVLQAIEKAEKENLPIYALGFHVDYWNYLGWNDRFSDPSYTRRQRWYSQIFRNRNIYTPQTIVNGTFEFGGYGEQKLNQELNRVIHETPSLSFTAKIAEKSEKGWLIDVDGIQGDIPKSSQLHIALVQNNLNSNVRSGENRGRFLKHTSVVRYFQTFDFSKNMNPVLLQKPALTEFKPSDSLLIVFVQNKHSGKILFATQLNEL